MCRFAIEFDARWHWLHTPQKSVYAWRSNILSSGLFLKENKQIKSKGLSVFKETVGAMHTCKRCKLCTSEATVQELRKLSVRHQTTKRTNKRINKQRESKSSFSYQQPSNVFLFKGNNYFVSCTTTGRWIEIC